MGNAELTPVTWRTPDEVDAQLSALQAVPLEQLLPAASAVTLPRYTDDRGTLVPVDVDQVLPFDVRRAWSITHASVDTVRGRHAHFVCDQAFWCNRGYARFVVTDGQRVAEAVLQSPSGLLIVPAGLWVQIDQFQLGTVLLAFASHPYDPDDYRTELSPGSHP